MENFPFDQTLHFVAQCLAREGIGEDGNSSLTQEYVDAPRVIAVFVADQDSIKLLWNDAQQLHAHDQLLGTKTRIHQNMSGATSDQCGIPLAATTQNSHANPTYRHCRESGQMGVILQVCSEGPGLSNSG